MRASGRRTSASTSAKTVGANTKRLSDRVSALKRVSTPVIGLAIPSAKKTAKRVRWADREAAFEQVAEEDSGTSTDTFWAVLEAAKKTAAKADLKAAAKAEAAAEAKAEADLGAAAKAEAEAEAEALWLEIEEREAKASRRRRAIGGESW